MGGWVSLPFGNLIGRLLHPHDLFVGVLAAVGDQFHGLGGWVGGCVGGLLIERWRRSRRYT